MSIYAELIKVMKKIEQPVRETKAHKYKYARLEHVIMSIKDAISSSEADLWFTQSTSCSETETKCTTTIFDSKGSEIVFESSLKAKSTTPQESGSAKTYLKRYALLEIFAITPIGEDDDGEIFQFKEKPPTISDEQKQILEEKIVSIEGLDKNSFATWVYSKFKVSMNDLSKLDETQYQIVMGALQKREGK